MLFNSGQGKTLIYALLPTAFKLLQQRNLVIVISPLIALVKDQQKRLESFGLKVLNVVEQDKDFGENLYYSIWVLEIGLRNPSI